MHSPTDQPQSMQSSMRPVVVVGLLIVALFFVGLGGWASTAPLTSAAIAPGVLSVESNRKEVQHLEGGIVSEIRVRDGTLVEAGQILIRLDETQALALLEQLRTRYWGATAHEARLLAERDAITTIAFPDHLLAQQDHPKVREAVAGESAIFAARRQSLAGQAAILAQRIAQYREEIVGLNGQITAETTQLDLVAQEIGSHAALVEKKLSGMQRLLELKREQAEIAGNRSRNIAAIARVHQNIAEEQLKILELDTSRINEVVTELREVQTEIFGLSDRIQSAQSVLERTDIRAPLGGTIVNLQIHTVGGVVTPGETLMDIVPSGERLVIQAQITPEDIDSVYPGLAAQVRLTAFNQRDVAPLDGRVVSVSADRLIDERTGTAYYLARIELPENPFAHDPARELYPGMQAEVMIITGQRTALEYILAPITRSVDKALREE